MKDDEPHFVLMARDPHFERVIGFWALLRLQDVVTGKDPMADTDKVIEAVQVGHDGSQWWEANKGKI